MKKIIIILSLLIGFIYAESGRPVMVIENGDDSHGLICEEALMIRGIDKHGDGFVVIRSGPGSKYSIKKKVVRNGKEVVGCEHVGNWIGIIYTDTDMGLGSYQKKCGLVSDYSLKQHPYKGPCKTGWIYKKYVESGFAN